ncbi:MAG TPA: hypothetical protein VJT72_04085, partial [Pseudonocardiaceae bacterium]|nr:hypothetical protein [Pseudonocardiaceae bacterium]
MWLTVTRRSLAGHAFRTLLAFALLTSPLFPTDVATAATEDYGEYSLMTERHSGQLYSDGRPAGQWSWTPQ